MSSITRALIVFCACVASTTAYRITYQDAIAINSTGSFARGNTSKPSKVATNVTKSDFDLNKLEPSAAPPSSLEEAGLKSMTNCSQRDLSDLRCLREGLYEHPPGQKSFRQWMKERVWPSSAEVMISTSFSMPAVFNSIPPMWKSIPVNDFGSEFRAYGTARRIVHALTVDSGAWQQCNCNKPDKHVMNLPVACPGESSYDGTDVWLVVRQMSDSWRDEYLKQFGGLVSGAGGVGSFLANTPSLIPGQTSPFYQAIMGLATNPSNLTADAALDHFFDNIDGVVEGQSEEARPQGTARIKMAWNALLGKVNDAFLTMGNPARKDYAGTKYKFICHANGKEGGGRVHWIPSDGQRDPGPVVKAKHLAVLISLGS